MLIPTLQNNHYLAFMAIYTADSLVSSKKCAKFAVSFRIGLDLY